MSIAGTILVAAVSGALEVIKNFVETDEFKKIADRVLNGIESKFEEGSLKDIVAESVTAQIRKRLEIIDSNPDN